MQWRWLQPLVVVLQSRNLQNMDYLHTNLQQIFERLASANQLAIEMKAWHRRQPEDARPSIPPPERSMLYEPGVKPNLNKLFYLCFWLLYGQAGAPYSVTAWGRARVLADHMRRMPPEEFWRWHNGILQGIDTVARLPIRPATEPDRLHLVGIGALNIDSIVRVPATLRTSTKSFDAGIEHVVSRESFEAQRASVSHLAMSECLGGSAFNVIQALSHASRDLKLGYIGCVGEDRSSQFFDWFDARKVDRSYVTPIAGARTSQSLSKIEGAERTLFTTKGEANDHLPKCMENNYGLIEYLSRASCIHISSIFDADMPRVLLDVILAVKARSPVTVSFDPGWVWCSQMDHDPYLQALLKQTDVLFLNPREFECLAGSTDLTDEQAARRILPRCGAGASVLVYKQRTRTSLFSWTPGGRFDPRHLEHKPLGDGEIVDSTGAGDVLAAGILPRFFFPNKISDGRAMELARRMVMVKLQSSGTDDFPMFETVWRDVLDEEAN